MCSGLFDYIYCGKNNLLIKYVPRNMQIKLSKINIIFLPVHYPKNDDLKDGYFQRVLAIDKILKQENFIRVYVAKPVKFTLLPQIREIESDIFEILANENNPIHLFYLLYFAIKSKRIYLHGIMRIKTPLHIGMFLFARKRIVDLHGAVPEELFLQGKRIKARIFEKVEHFITKHADIIVSVTESMTKHVQKKHNLQGKIFIQLPIFSQKKDILVVKEFSRKVIYCGGLQKWQNIDKMFKFVKNHKNECEFTFLVSDQELLKKTYLDIYGENFPGIVRSVAPEEVPNWYLKNNFGLVLRDDIVVNRVACPTKLIEYLQNDIVPIVNTANIGDFKQLEYQYVDFNDNLPEQDKWQMMIIKNREVVKKLNNISKKGAELLAKSI